SRKICAALTRCTLLNRSCAWRGSYRVVIAIVQVITWGITERAQERPSRRATSRALFLPTALASCEIGRDDSSATASGERPESDADPDAAETRAEQYGPVTRACEPLTDDPLSGHAGAPGEVLAEDGAARTVSERPPGNRSVGEVLTLQHVRGMTAGGAKKTNVHSQGGETMTRPHRIHRLEERGLRAAQRPCL